MDEMQTRRRPGEMVFSVLMLALGLFILWTAYGIAGFTALSSPGAFPMAAGAVMVVAATVTLLRDVRRPAARDGASALFAQIMPPVVGIFIGLIAVFGILFESAGFLASAFVFLLASIWYLHKRGIVPALLLAVVSLIGVYVVFRLIFSVVLPEGVIPEREIMAAVRNLFRGSP
jgi:putative tricarboxylic transport membrane protein